MHGSTRSILDRLDAMHDHLHESARERAAQAATAHAEREASRPTGPGADAGEGSPDAEASTSA